MNTVAATAVSAASCVLCIIGLAIPYWVYFSAGGVTFNAGLWMGCQDTCTAYSGSIPSALKAVRAMEVLGMLLISGAVVLGILKLIAMKDKSVLLKVAGVCAIVAGVFMVIGTIIFAAKVKKDLFSSMDLHAGFALCIIAGVGSVVGGVLFLITREQ